MISRLLQVQVGVLSIYIYKVIRIESMYLGYYRSENPISTYLMFFKIQDIFF